MNEQSIFHYKYMFFNNNIIIHITLILIIINFNENVENILCHVYTNV